MHLGSRRTVLPLEGSTASPVPAPWCLGGFLGGHVQDAPTFRRSPRGKHRGHDSWLAARTRGPRTPGLPWQCPPSPALLDPCSVDEDEDGPGSQSGKGQEVPGICGFQQQVGRGSTPFDVRNPRERFKSSEEGLATGACLADCGALISAN